MKNNLKWNFKLDEKMELQIELDYRKMSFFTSFAVHRLRKEKKFSTFFTLSPPTPMLT